MYVNTGSANIKPGSISVSTELSSLCWSWMFVSALLAVLLESPMPDISLSN